MADKHHDELHVERTTPQGTQENGVDQGYEMRDIKMRPLMGWMIGLGVLMVVVFISMIGFWNILAAFENRQDVLPTPLFAVRQSPPPGQPLLLPNPYQKPADPHTPWEVGQVERDKENTQLTKVGLASQIKSGDSGGAGPKPTGATKNPVDGNFVPALPANVQNLVAAEQPKAGGNAAGAPTVATRARTTRTANGVATELADLDQRQSDSSGGLRVEGRQQ